MVCAAHPGCESRLGLRVAAVSGPTWLRPSKGSTHVLGAPELVEGMTLCKTCEAGTVNKEACYALTRAA